MVLANDVVKNHKTVREQPHVTVLRRFPSGCETFPMVPISFVLRATWSAFDMAFVYRQRIVRNGR